MFQWRRYSLLAMDPSRFHCPRCLDNICHHTHDMEFVNHLSNITSVTHVECNCGFALLSKNCPICDGHYHRPCVRLYCVKGRALA
ncbi:hypothetical protein BDP81DRAFT_422130 [Colletotrichum phormii]|uniref:Uncharacterized protein n=1 Tax=Colletotrichum phormii TaxID=359342 RepID=A0AAI9ZZU9_9PEZI|nr:uncharacterized protein BDP81DRAFT_422130 [Colletotrichum phormii]KAK1639948.1 hypothetical protein BDP81DRAFT_422130 [Colletotrichum phormii]